MLDVEHDLIAVPAFLQCPCCHGEKTLTVHDETGFNPPMKLKCCHCDGRGVIATVERKKEDDMGYPANWPQCPKCGEPALDGHITCGSVECNESEKRLRRSTRDKVNENKMVRPQS
jgi:hypothetical protein